MCGIIAAFKTKPNSELGVKGVNEAIVNQYENQFRRGTEGYGILAWNNKTKKPEIKRATEAAKFMFDLHSKEWPMMIAHHRNPTSSDNKIDQTHPLFVSHESLEFDYYLVHNGVITNASDMRGIHEAQGFKYRTLYRKAWTNREEIKFNDSESLAIEVSRFIEGKIKTMQTKGSAAFITAQVDKTTGKINRIYFGRDGNPLKMAKSRTELYLSSDGKGTNIEEGILYSFEPKDTMDLKKEKMSFTPYSSYLFPKATPTQETLEEKKEEKKEEKTETAVGFHTGGKEKYNDKDDFGEWDNYKDDISINGEKTGFYVNKELEQAEDEAVSLIQEYLTNLDFSDSYIAGQSLRENLIIMLKDIFKEAEEKLGDKHYEEMLKEGEDFIPNG